MNLDNPPSISDAEKYGNFMRDVLALRRAGNQIPQRLANEIFMRDTLGIEPIKVDPIKGSN